MTFPDSEQNILKAERILEDKKFVNKSIFHKMTTIQFEHEKKDSLLFMNKKIENANQEFWMIKPETNIIKLNFWGYFRY